MFKYSIYFLSYLLGGEQQVSNRYDGSCFVRTDPNNRWSLSQDVSAIYGELWRVGIQMQILLFIQYALLYEKYVDKEDDLWIDNELRIYPSCLSILNSKALKQFSPNDQKHIKQRMAFFDTVFFCLFFSKVH